MADVEERLAAVEAAQRELEEHYAMLLGFLHSLLDGDGAATLDAQHGEFLARCRARDASNPGRRRRGL